MKLDDFDLALMRATQAGLPLVSQPYHVLAEQLACTPEEVMSRLQTLQENRVIRRIGAVPNHYRLGYRFNGMTVWNIADEHIDECGQTLGQLPFVSHCYQRPRHLPLWQYNLFAMIHAKSQDEIQEQIGSMAELLTHYHHGYEVLLSSEILKKTGFRSRLP